MPAPLIHAYGLIKQAAAHSNAELGVLDEEAKERLKKSQRAWIAFRDAEAAFRADAEARGGSMWPLVHEGIRGALTKERVKMLREYLLEEKGQ